MTKVVDFPLSGTIGTTQRPKRYDIELYRGDTLAFDLIFKDSNEALIDVTGWVPKANIMKADGTPGETPDLDVVVGTTDGKVTVGLSNTETAALNGTTEYRYDIQLTSGTQTRTFIGGIITVTEDISI